MGSTARLSRHLVLALSLSVGVASVAACGGKDKAATTTPGDGTGTGTGDPSDPTGMGGGDPGDPNNPGGGGGTGDPVLPGGNGTDGGGDGTGDGTGDGGTATAPPIAPPNLDPDPAAASAAVQKHLEVARAALRKSTPDGDAALAAAKAALAVDASNVDAAVMVAYAYYTKRLVDTAEVILDGVFARESAKQNAGLYFVYGLIYDEQGKAPQAFLSYQKAVQLDDRNASALTNLGVHQLRNKQYDRAIATYERVSKTLGVNSAEVLTGLGSAYRGRTSDFPANSSERRRLLLQAEVAFKQAVAANSKYGPAYYDLGLLYLDSSPFPTDSGTLDNLIRLQRSKSFFDQYKTMPGADQTLYEDRNKDVTKLIKREEKARKSAAS